MQSRREWFKSSIGIGGLMLTPSILSAEEIKKYNPRPKSSIVKLSSNENPYGPSERVLNAIKNSFSDLDYKFEHSSQPSLLKEY